MAFKSKTKINLYRTKLYLTSSRAILEKKKQQFFAPYVIKCIRDTSRREKRVNQDAPGDLITIGKGRIRNKPSLKCTIGRNINWLIFCLNRIIIIIIFVIWFKLLARFPRSRFGARTKILWTGIA